MPKKKHKKPSRIAGLEIITVRVKKIKPHPQNARIHDQINIDAIAGSLQEFGQQTPLVININNEILKGCGTWEAMKQMKWKECSVVIAKGLTKEQELAYAIADNKTGDLSEFDFEKLAEVIKHLDGKDIDLSVTGFQNFELQPLMEGDFKPPEVDDMPTLSEEDEGEKLTLTFKDADILMINRAIRKYSFTAESDPTAEETVLYLCEKYLTPKKRTQ